MLRTIFIKLTKVGTNAGPFSIYDQLGTLIAENIARKVLLEGAYFSIDVVHNITMIRLATTGDCSNEKTKAIGSGVDDSIFSTNAEITRTACLWRHLRNPEIYNSYYGAIKEYIIEYPFAYTYNDEILQNVKDYTRVYKYFADAQGVSNEPSKIELNDIWFNKAIVYNGQQCSGILNLTPKPKNNLKLYNSYPIYRTDGKDIIFTKSDNWYQYNTFWSIVKDKDQPLFIRTCKSLSYDKEVNQDNMNYAKTSFKKATLRAKELKIRHILDNRSDINILSNIIFSPTQLSYK